MDTKRHILAAFALSVLQTSAYGGVNAAIVKLNDDGRHFIYAANKINQGDTIYFQFPKKGHAACCSQASWKAVGILAADPDAVDYTSDRQLYRYRLRASGFEDALPFVGIAAIGRNLAVAADGEWRVTASSGAAKSRLALCTSQEGIHVTSQAEGTNASDLYLYLGYDIENPTCTAPASK